MVGQGAVLDPGAVRPGRRRRRRPPKRRRRRAVCCRRPHADPRPRRERRRLHRAPPRPAGCCDGLQLGVGGLLLAGQRYRRSALRPLPPAGLRGPHVDGHRSRLAPRRIGPPRRARPDPPRHRSPHHRSGRSRLRGRRRRLVGADHRGGAGGRAGGDGRQALGLHRARAPGHPPARRQVPGPRLSPHHLRH